MYSIALSKKRSLHIPPHSNIIRYRTFLKKVSKVAKNPVKVANLLQKAKPGELKALTEIALNLLKKNYPDTGKEHLNKLIPFKNVIRRLATVKKPRNLLLRHNNQSGGLPFMIPLLAPIISALISAGIQAAV
jgi:hypothetical protein